MKKIALGLILIFIMALSMHSQEKGVFSKEIFEQFIGKNLTVINEGPITSEKLLLIDVKESYLVCRSSEFGPNLIFIRIDSIVSFYVHDLKNMKPFYRKRD